VDSEHDKGFKAGAEAAANECCRLIKSHIDRLEPGKQQRIREALLLLEASVRNRFFAQAKIKEHL
jgi:hypothetical protein